MGPAMPQDRSRTRMPFNTPAMSLLVLLQPEGPQTVGGGDLDAVGLGNARLAELADDLPTRVGPAGRRMREIGGPVQAIGTEIVVGRLQPARFVHEGGAHLSLEVFGGQKL